MRKESTGSRSESRPEWEQLEDWVRSQVQRLIQELLEEEVTEFLGRAKSALRSDSDSDTGYRNGYGRARRLTLSSGTIQLRRPRVRDTEEQFESRPLDDLEVVYMWVDGVYVKAGLEKEKAAVLVVMAALSDGSKVVVSSKLNSERRHLHPLPPAPVPEYVNYRVRVRRWSTIRVANRTYSVPSRLIGVVVDVRLYADHIKVCYKGHLVESMERVHGTGEAQIDYRHIIGSLVRKPGAFARYRFREQMFPTHTFRLAYDALCGWRGERADVEYVRILHLAATTMESEVDRALGRLLESGLSFDYAMVRRLSAPAPPPVPDLKLSGTVDLGVYDRLLVGGAR